MSETTVSSGVLIMKCIFESSTAVIDCEDCWAKYYCVRRGTRRKSSSEVTSIESDR
jgi:hypothetical protein